MSIAYIIYFQITYLGKCFRIQIFTSEKTQKNWNLLNLFLLKRFYHVSSFFLFCEYFLHTKKRRIKITKDKKRKENPFSILH